MIENTRGCPDRQRSDRSAAMRMLQCNMKFCAFFGIVVETQRSRAGVETENDSITARLQYRLRSG